MKKYELLYILRPNLEDVERTRLMENINHSFLNYDSKITKLTSLGLQDLAYDIQHYSKGYYVSMFVSANTQAIAEFNRVVRITEEIMRFILIKEE